MNTVFQDFMLGLRCYFKSFGFISRNRMWHFYLYPILFIFVFSVSAFLGIRALVDLIEPTLNSLFGIDPIPGDGFFDKFMLVVKQTGRYIVHAVIWVSLMFIYYKINKYIVLIVMSPVMAVIAERTDRIITGRDYPMSIVQIIKDAMRGVVIALRNAVLEIGIMILLLAFNFLLTLLFPPVAVISTPLVSIVLFGIGAYFYGFSTIDYSSERYRLSFRESIRLVRRNKGIALANGTIFTLWLIVPIFGTYIGTIFAPVTCTVGATMALLEKGVLNEVDQKV